MYYTIVKYGPTTNMLLKCLIYTTCKNHLMYTNGVNMPNIYVTYELNGINHVTRSFVHKRGWQWCQTMQHDDNDATAWLSKVSWPLGHVSQKAHFPFFSAILTYTHKYIWTYVRTGRQTHIYTYICLVCS